MLVTQPGPVSPRVEMIGSAEIPVYIARGEKWAVIESGVSIIAPSIVGRLNSMPGAAEKIAFLIVTHSHFDHVGSLPALMRAFPEARVVASQVAAEVFRKPGAMAYIRAMNDSFVKLLDLEKMNPGFDFSIPDEIRVDMRVKEGYSINLGGGVELEIYDVPGHSRCSIALFLKPDRALFAGESAGFYNGPGDVISEGLSNYSAYLEGLDKMKALTPDVVCLPHNGVLTGDEAREYFDIAIKNGKEFRLELERRLHEGQPDEKIIAEITEEKYKGLITTQPRDVFHGNLRAMINAVRKEMTP